MKLSIQNRIFALETNPKLGLENTTKLLSLLKLEKNNIQQKVIQIVGTNGKGSTCAFLESILMLNNLKVGVFSSPHLTSARERIRINQVNISEEDFSKIGEQVLEQIECMSEKPSFFEALLAMAMLYFKDQTDIIILEAGIGGRLDATTACEADILGVASIGLDHLSILGNTLEKIALEKIAAARFLQPVITVAQKKEVLDTIIKQKKLVRFDLSLANICAYSSSLPGEHQYINAGLAKSLSHSLGYNVEEELIKKAMLKAKWPARFEIFDYKNHTLIIDGAHNAHAIEVISKHINTDRNLAHKNWQMVFACLSGHDPYEMALIFKNNHPNLRKIFLAKVQNPRSLLFTDLKQAFVKAGFDENILYEFIDLDTTLLNNSNEFTLVCGSLYLAGEIRKNIVPMDCDEKLSTY